MAVKALTPDRRKLIIWLSAPAIVRAASLMKLPRPAPKLTPLVSAVTINGHPLLWFDGSPIKTGDIIARQNYQVTADFLNGHLRNYRVV